MNTITKRVVSAFAVTTLAVAALFAAPTGAFAQTTKNHPPVINGISSPTVLTIDQTGTWSVSAYDPEDGNLSYSVDWGDTATPLMKAASLLSFVQTTSFSHSYATPGNYTIKFTVRDDAGLTAQSSVTVHVKPGAANPLIISNTVATSSKPTHATIKWDTNIKSSSIVWYSTSTPIDTSKPPQISRPNSLTHHKIELDKLTPDTTYYVIVKSNAKDASAISSEFSFKTPALPSKAPVITNVAGPQALVTDEEGTWTLNAYDPHNTGLSYSVDWGDVQTMGIRALFAVKEPVFVQTSTFTHNYADPGTYTITFSVKNDAGLTTQSTTSVTVSQATTTTDTTPPSLTNIAVGSVDSTQATITWVTDENADSRVWVGTSTNVDTSASSTVSDGTLVTAHSLSLTGLSASTTYFAVVGSTDASGNMSTSSPVSFTTPAVISTSTPPVVSTVTSQVGSTTATIGWNTDVAADSTLYFATSSPVVIGASSTAFITNTAQVTSHSLTATGLTASTTYYFLVQSKNAGGDTATSSESSFTTTNP